MSKLNVKDIQRDTSRFQFRSVEFDEGRVVWLVENWDGAKVDPLDVWNTSEGYFLLSGHHRHEAMVRLGLEECECRIHVFSLEDAQNFALTSNANRLQYTDYEYSRGIQFLKEVHGMSFTEAANQMTISPGMAQKYYSLRHLAGTNWERQNEVLNLSTRAFEIGAFCEKHPLSKTELESLFKIVTKNDLSASQVKQLIRDIKRHMQRQGGDNSDDQQSLFNMNDFSEKIVKAVKTRDFLNMCSAQAWWLYELIQKTEEHEFPIDIQEPFMRELRRFYAYCVGSEDENIVPQRATAKGRNLRVGIDKKKAS